ncbi:phosphatidylserine/phosphatidylglycerophosphate/cardiolipin synthase family protein [Luteolibacter arcticus]|uniref:Phosphatidylserine/phosphatidylglycerophosphate/ cardiolipin synthase family protein n=1 Tax=Luteolibacter arcticus TaxID=1581411 RepID=A0ABT3GJY8_9BACT|nr:phosphatidylserine/phosphatidylglycerophosphate/cardiolipin synthase family protein [Luteolibacter arcticus]MCW1923829.1 phosphatidylserine/phosphatidylglycerophosphate/cardiolipin synthase family protein [Luteolibacter arcticus]
MFTSHAVLPLAGALMVASCSGLAQNYRYPSGLRDEKTATKQDDHKLSRSALGLKVVGGTALSAARQPVATARVGGMVLWQRPFELLAGGIPGSHKVLPLPPEVPGTPEFEALLDRKRLPAAVPGKLTWLVDGKDYVPELNRQARAARHSIDSQVYIFDNDDAAVAYADILRQRSSEVSVRVVFDELGSMMSWGKPPETPYPGGGQPPRDMSRYLRQGSNVKVRSIPNPWLVCDHTKLHVFDRQVAVMGCANIGREYASEWHDLLFRVEGPAVAKLQQDYNATWRRADPVGLFGAFRRKTAVPPDPREVKGAYPLRIIRTDPAAGRREIQKSMVLAIRAARTRIWIEDPYVSNDDITEALEDAARRGVDVRMIYPSKNDSKIMDIANRAFATKLVKAGGRAYAYPKMTHLKVMICDGWACVGSANLDTLSMRINRELNVAFNDRRAIDALIASVFRPDFAVSSPHRESDPASAPLIETIADQL